MLELPGVESGAGGEALDEHPPQGEAAEGRELRLGVQRLDVALEGLAKAVASEVVDPSQLPRRGASLR